MNAPRTVSYQELAESLKDPHEVNAALELEHSKLRYTGPAASRSARQAEWHAALTGEKTANL